MASSPAFPCQSQKNRITCIQNAQVKQTDKQPITGGTKRFHGVGVISIQGSENSAILSLLYCPLRHHLPQLGMTI